MQIYKLLYNLQVNFKYIAVINLELQRHFSQI